MTPELRIDPISGHRVIVAPDAAAASVIFAAPPVPAAQEQTPVLGSERGRDRGEPLLGVKANRENDLFWTVPAQGEHERVQAGGGDLPAALETWRERMRAHAGAACLVLAADGATLPGAELFALPFVPSEIARERERFGAYATRTMGGNLLGDLVQEEVRKRERIVAIDRDGVLMCAFAARAPFQMLLAPRTPRARFEDEGPTCGALLADGLDRLARHLGSLPPLQLWVRTAPQGAEHFAWRIEIVPRTAPGALEAAAGIPVCPLAPEDAAARLRDA